jgi:RimJ/RimL family protein N-acetyltransferase
MLKFNHFPELIIGNTLLRAPKLEDVERIFFLRTDHKVNEFIHYPSFKELDDARNWLLSKPDSFHEEEEITWIAEDLISGNVIGAVGFSLNKELKTAEIGGRLDYKYWGSKRAILATKCIMDYLFQNTDYVCIEANVLSDNFRAKSILNYFHFEFISSQWIESENVNLDFYTLSKQNFKHE